MRVVQPHEMLLRRVQISQRGRGRHVRETILMRPENLGHRRVGLMNFD